MTFDPEPAGQTFARCAGPPGTRTHVRTYDDRVAIDFTRELALIAIIAYLSIYIIAFLLRILQ